MAYLVLGIGVGVLAACTALLSGAGLATIALAYVGGGSAVLLAALTSAMMFEDAPSNSHEDSMLSPHR